MPLAWQPNWSSARSKMQAVMPMPHDVISGVPLSTSTPFALNVLMSFFGSSIVPGASKCGLSTRAGEIWRAIRQARLPWSGSSTRPNGTFLLPGMWPDRGSLGTPSKRSLGRASMMVADQLGFLPWQTHVSSKRNTRYSSRDGGLLGVRRVLGQEHGIGLCTLNPLRNLLEGAHSSRDERGLERRGWCLRLCYGTRLDRVSLSTPGGQPTIEN